MAKWAPLVRLAFLVVTEARERTAQTGTLASRESPGRLGLKAKRGLRDHRYLGRLVRLGSLGLLEPRA